MEDYEQIVDLLNLYGELSFRLGKYISHLRTTASPVDEAVVAEYIEGTSDLQLIVKNGILSYWEIQVDELDLMERLLDRKYKLD